jgi:hypothetical protein
LINIESDTKLKKPDQLFKTGDFGIFFKISETKLQNDLRLIVEF